MKSIISLVFVFVLASQASSQNDSNGENYSSERNYYFLQQAEKQIFDLPFSIEHIQSVIIPEIHGQRVSLAPNYPDRSNLPRDLAIIDQAFINWIESFPEEHKAYLDYLKVYFRTNN